MLLGGGSEIKEWSDPFTLARGRVAILSWPASEDEISEWIRGYRLGLPALQ